MDRFYGGADLCMDGWMDRNMKQLHYGGILPESGVGGDTQSIIKLGQLTVPTRRACRHHEN